MKTERREYQPSEFVSTITGESVYAIDAPVGKAGWAKLNDERGKPMQFKTAAERDAALKDLLS